ncbi:uncharacterized protein LOC111105496 isoform X2 [Crassostrea virginica]
MRRIGLCLIVLCGCYYLVKGNRHCSWSNKTVEVVSSCPTSHAEVEERKLKKNCVAFANLQNCTEPDKFLYHCVIDDLETSFVEVCAPVYIINHKGCYAAVKRVSSTTEFTVIHGEEKIPEKVLGITVGVLIAVIFGVLCALTTRQVVRRRQQTMYPTATEVNKEEQTMYPTDPGDNKEENDLDFHETHFK